MPSFGVLIYQMNKKIDELEKRYETHEKKYNQLLILLKAMVDGAYKRQGKAMIKWRDICRALEEFLLTELPKKEIEAPADLVAELVKKHSRKY